MLQEETFQETLKQLSETTSATGGTSLVSLMVPGETQMSIIASQLNKELSTSQSIKDKDVRTNIQSSLKALIQQIKPYGASAPANGLVMIAGETKYCI
jgi:peptide subunit release factor 1 (eRF1)